MLTEGERQLIWDHARHYGRLAGIAAALEVTALGVGCALGAALTYATAALLNRKQA